MTLLSNVFFINNDISNRVERVVIVLLPSRALFTHVVAAYAVHSRSMTVIKSEYTFRK